MIMNRIFVCALLVATLASAAIAAPSLEERKMRLKAMETHMSQEAVARKERSEAILRAEGVPISKSLPVIETASEVRVRTKEEVAYRALALLTVAVKGEGLEQPAVERIVGDYGLVSRFTPKERAFFRETAPSQRDRVQFTWRYEAAWTLLWALGYVEKLDKPSGVCDVVWAVRLMKERTAAQFVAGATLRPIADILDQADRIYRYHWAVVEARVNGRASPGGVDPDVTVERHYALNWLIGYMAQDWDDISTDT